MPDETDTRSNPEQLGVYLRTLRTGAKMTLRDVEEATNRAVSNAYLSQVENGKIAQPSPHVLHSLASVYGASYEGLMQRAGYISRSTSRRAQAKHGRAATNAIENLTDEEERELLKYLSYIRSTKKT